MMVVLAPTTVAFPVAIKETLSIMARRHPKCPSVGWTGPVSCMPFIVISHWIPVPSHPDEFRSWGRWQNLDHTRGWWRSDPNSDGNLAEQRPSDKKCHSESSLPQGHLPP